MTGTRTRTFLPLAVLALLVLGACAGAMSGAGSMHMWPTGTSVTYEVSATEVMTMEQPGAGAMSLTTNTKMVLDVEGMAGDRVFKVTVSEATMSSDAEAMGQEMPNYGALVGFESTVTLDQRGKITLATNMDNPTLSEVGGAQSFQESLQGLFVYLPEGGALGPGVTWNRDYSFVNEQTGFQMNIASSDEYICDERTTFEGSPAFKITSRSTATLSGAGDQQGMEMNMMASGDGETTLYIEVGTGRILHAESMGMFSGGIDVPAMGMSIPLELRMTSTVRPAKK